MKRLPLISLLILLTINTSGQNWIELNTGTSADIYDLSFTDDGEGWAVCFYPGDILRSSDGGLDWSVNTTLPIILKSVTFQDSLHGLVGGIDANTNRSSIYVTVDGGVNWNLQEFQGSPNGGQSVDQIHLSGGKGYIFGHNALCRHSTDPLSTTPGWINLALFNGHVWSSYVRNPDTLFFCTSTLWSNVGGSLTVVYQNEVHDINFVSPQVGFAVTPDNLLRTDDGGLTWDSVADHPLPSTSIVQIVALSENVLYVGGMDGKVYVSVDGGNNWSLDYEVGSGVVIKEMKLIDQTLWAVGTNGLIMAKFNVFSSVNDKYENRILSIYPNPTTSTITLQTETLLSQAWLTDLAGRRLMPLQSNGTQWQADLSALPAGIYLIEAMTQDGARAVKKVVRG